MSPIDMSTAAKLLRDARRHAGLTQAELAERLGITQSAVAKLERPGANPAIGTLERAVGATGHRLQLIAPVFGEMVDIGMLRHELRSTPQQRLDHFERLTRFSSALGVAGAEARGDVA